MTVATLSLRSRSLQNLAALALAIALLATLPFLGLIAFAARFAVFALLIVGGGGALIAYAASPRFRAWLDPEDSVMINGLRLARNVALHPGHSWARVGRHRATVGADDLTVALLGPPDEVELPKAGARVTQGTPMLRLQRGDRKIELRAPITGEVTAVNRRVLEEPDLPFKDPYERGWLLRIRPEHPREERESLFRGEAALRWFRAEVDRLLMTLLPPPVAGAAASLPDGGAIVRDLHRLVDDESWSRLHLELFD